MPCEANAIAYVVVNPQMFSGLTAGEQTMFLAAAKEADAHLRGHTEKDEMEAFDFLRDKGMQVNLTPDAESFRVATASVIEKNPDLFLPELVKIARATPA